MLNAIIPRIVQGLTTEFLPISSNAHLRLVRLLLGTGNSGCRLHRDHPARHRARRHRAISGGPLAHHLALVPLLFGRILRKRS
jgi:hypothetical protein